MARLESPKAWRLWLAACIAFRLAIPLLALSFEGTALPGLPAYVYAPLYGDANGYYAVRARSSRRRDARLRSLVAVAVGGAAIVLVARRRRAPSWLLALLVGGWISLAATVVIVRMQPSGATVVGWPLVWALPLAPLRALDPGFGPDAAFIPGLVLSLAANAVTCVAVAYLGARATGRRSVGAVAVALYALWPFIPGLVVGSGANGNGQWDVENGLHLYTEPLSTALVITAVALILRTPPTDLSLAIAGLALGYATAVKITDAAIGVALFVVLLAFRRFRAAGLLGRRRPRLSRPYRRILEQGLRRVLQRRRLRQPSSVRAPVRDRCLDELDLAHSDDADAAARARDCRLGDALAEVFPGGDRCSDRSHRRSLQLLRRHSAPSPFLLRRAAACALARRRGTRLDLVESAAPKLASARRVAQQCADPRGSTVSRISGSVLLALRGWLPRSPFTFQACLVLVRRAALCEPPWRHRPLPGVCDGDRRSRSRPLSGLLVEFPRGTAGVRRARAARRRPLLPSLQAADGGSCGALTLVLAARSLAAVGATRRRYLCLAPFALLPLLLGHVYLNRYDALPALLLVATLLLLLLGRGSSALAVLGLAVAAKLFPAAVLPVAGIRIFRERGRRAMLWAFASFTG